MAAAAASSLAALLKRPGDSRYFLIGCAAYPVLHVATTGLGFDGPRRFLYVVGHELTHAAAAWMSGYNVNGFSVGAEGGHVDVSRSNWFIALAPYVVPLYALAVVLGYRLWLWYASVSASGLAHEVFLLALGAALSFHWLFTAGALWSVKQPDLDLAGGTIFSLVLICLGNGVVLLLALKCLFPRVVSLAAAARLAHEFTAGFWLGLFRLVPGVP